MDKKYFGSFIKTTLIAVAALVINLAVLYLVPELKAQMSTFIYPVPLIYLFFYIFSAVILAALITISKKNMGQLGYVFLILTTIKMGASYFLVKPILAKTIAVPVEKVNFFIVFTLFLAVEAYFTARLLNNKQ